MSDSTCWVINPEFAKGFKKIVLDIGGHPYVYVEELGILCTIADTYSHKSECIRGKEAVAELGAFVKGDEEVIA